MKKPFYYILAFLAISMILITCSKNPTDPINPSGDKTCYIVTFNQNGSSIQSANIDTKVKDLFSKHDISLSSLKYTYNKVLNGFAAFLTEEQIASLKSDKKIKNIEKDQTFSLVDGVDAGKPGNDPPPTSNWGVTSVGGNVYGTSSYGVVWIIDTGIDFDHPDLNVNTNLSKSFVNGALTADDDNGHGTHCAGIIGCTKQEIGVCPGASVIPVKVLNLRGSGFTSDIIAGIDYVAENLVKDGTGNLLMNVVNMSFGGNKSTDLDNSVSALAGYGAYICIAAGNSKKNAGNYSPSRVDGDRIYTISAHDQNDYFASFSNYGNPPIDYAAPGVNILSCFNDGGYTVMSGTSMAAPHCCAILLANWGSIFTSRTVINDRDNIPDQIAQISSPGGN